MMVFLSEPACQLPDCQFVCVCGVKVLGDKAAKAEAFNRPSKHFQHLDENRVIIES